jgi:isoleucyl-tRNA synthetase
VPLDQLPLLDRWALRQSVRLMALARRVYGPEASDRVVHGPETYQYQVLCQELMRFATVDMGAAYLDMTKDRLYTMPEAHPARRAAQTAMYWTLEILARAFAPILAFTADEIWAELPDRRHDSVLFATWQELDALEAVALDAGEEALLDQLFAWRDQVQKKIEVLRGEGRIGGSLEAEVTIATDAATFERLADLRDELRFFFIVSSVDVVIAGDGAGDTISVVKSEAPKCVRCWQHRADVGSHDAHPELCGRCVANVDGPGEMRRYF